eukprot:CCRYP_012443-RD/>CCRYP_012443-RD protein AED:0.12 eAED:0.12 QI:268/1/1/1/1/0.66/3/4084/973
MSTDQLKPIDRLPLNEESNANGAVRSVSGDRQPRRRGGRGGRGRNRRGSAPEAAAAGAVESANTEHSNTAAGNLNSPRPNGSNRRRRGRGGPKPEPQPLTGTEAPSSPRTEQALEFIADSLPDSSGPTSSTAAGASKSNTENGIEKQRVNKSRQRQRKSSVISANNSENGVSTQNAYQTNDASIDNPTQSTAATADGSKKKKRRNRTRSKRNNPASKPWLSAIPPGTVDPISLDPLEDLPYPPFALVMDEPYTAVYPGMWPPPPLEESTDEKVEKASSNLVTRKEADVDKDRELSILKEQWGEEVVRSDENSTSASSKNRKKPASIDSHASLQGRQFYLFDGFVLAGYLTRTLQFINPYNRRDLTRAELAALDAYMAVHKLGNAGVVQAYDEKGVTLSTAGVAGQTADGRAEILQQEARAIRNAFFRGGGSNPGVLDRVGSNQQRPQSRRQQRQNDVSGEQVEEITNGFRRMYQDQSRNQPNDARPVSRERDNHDTGIYAGEDGGFLMIDDDINPGLRSGIPTNDTGALYSARHLAEQHSHQAQTREGNFPSLPSASSATASVDISNSSSQKLSAAPSKSLKSITKVVKKTDPAELARQKKAREEAQRKAELSRLNYFDPSSTQPSVAGNGLVTAPVAAEKMPPTEAVLERNRNFANALGVVPAPLRNEPALTGWARPTTVEIQLDQFGNELNTTQYPDALLSQAKERMTELIKLEKAWKKFLADDKEASYSLKPMDRATRLFVHEYSDFWRLKTQSYDPEGRRYIHCSKLVDTSAPYPLLSDAAKKWRGPVSGASQVPYRAPVSLPPASKTSEAAPIPESTTTSWHTEQRVPLKLTPRTIVQGAPMPISKGMGMTRSSSTPLLSMTGEKPAPPRFADLHDKERPKLQLAPRTIPPSEESQKLVAHDERTMRKEEARLHRHAHKEKKKRDKEEKKRAILESAFASDDDGVDWSSDSDWFEDDAAFEGSDDEGL